MPLPVSYLPNGSNGHGRRHHGHAPDTWFGGVYQDPANFFAQIVGRAGTVHEAVSGIQGVAGTIKCRRGWLRSAGRAGRRRPGQSLRMEGRRSHPDCRHHLAAASRARCGNSTLPACMTARRASTRPSSSSATTTSTKISAGKARAWSAGTSSRSTDAVAGAADEREVRRRCSPIRRPRPRRPRKKGFVEGFAKQIGDIGAIMNRHSPSPCCSP